MIYKNEVQTLNKNDKYFIFNNDIVTIMKYNRVTKKISFLFGLSIMLTSIAFHRSAFIGIVCALGSLCSAVIVGYFISII